MSQFSTDIRLIKCKDNPVKYTLSALEINTLPDDIMCHDLIDDKKFKLNITRSTHENFTATPEIPNSVQQQESILLCHTKRPGHYIPSTRWKKVFDHLHSLSHPSRRAKERFVRTNIITDTCEWITTCL